MQNQTSIHTTNQNQPLTLPTIPSRSEDPASSLDFSVSVCTYDEISTELYALRSKIYHEEFGLLPKQSLIEENDYKADHLIIRCTSTGELIAASILIHAEISDFATHSGLKASQLTSWYFGSRAMVHPKWRLSGVYKLLVYIGSLHCQVNGRKGFIAYIEQGPDKPAQKILSTQALHFAKPRTVVDTKGNSYVVYPVLCEAEQTRSKIFKTLTSQQKKFLADYSFINEIEREIKAGISKFYNGRFCQRVIEGKLSKSEYILSVSNNYQFVRWTTRLLARIACETSDRKLRNHYLSHLSGEVDHDVWLENDLRELGADVEYVRDEMVPNVHIGQFMSIQESAAAFYKDPIQFLAVPISIEAITAFMPKEFGKGLMQCISSWGLSNPSKACTFMMSHIYTDGGDDGHWAKTIEVLKENVITDKQRRTALLTIKMIFDAVYRAYDNYVDPLAVDSHPDYINN
ncbi:MAG: hypothetical protein NT027_03825 [Proteobacteria bacterium]|nr:hypothetical protein [Pseudomonadota bacterium]